MTAVEWLEEELKANLKKVILEADSELMESLFEQAKEKDKEQKISFANQFATAVMGGCILTPTEFYNKQNEIKIMRLSKKNAQ